MRGQYVPFAYYSDVTKLVNSSGTVVVDYTYDAFGNQTSETEDSNPFRYAGEYWDSESGLIYLRARYYDSGVGAFASEDPAKDGLNWYVYANNNAINFFDPFGLAARYVNSQTSLNMRSGAGTNYGVIISIPRGAEVNYTGNKTSMMINGHYWAEVTYNGTTGWVAATSPEAAEELKALEASERDFVMSVTVMSSGMITGYTKHGLAQAIGRDGGKGVNPQAILDAVKNPQQIIHQAGETIKYIGENATVVLNKFGEIVTTWARNSFGTLQAVDLRTVRAVLEQVLDEKLSGIQQLPVPPKPKKAVESKNITTMQPAPRGCAVPFGTWDSLF